MQEEISHPEYVAACIDWRGGCCSRSPQLEAQLIRQVLAWMSLRVELLHAVTGAR